MIDNNAPVAILVMVLPAINIPESIALVVIPVLIKVTIVDVFIPV
jgi:hypothetical protein